MSFQAMKKPVQACTQKPRHVLMLLTVRRDRHDMPFFRPMLIDVVVQAERLHSCLGTLHEPTEYSTRPWQCIGG